MTGSRAILSLKIIPGASKDEMAGRMGDAVKIRLRAPAVDGKANKALIEFLSDQLQCSRAQIKILTGECARLKRVEVQGFSQDELQTRLSPP